MKCGYNGCTCKMKKCDLFDNSYPQKFECPKCHSTAIVEKSGLCKRYDLNGKIYTFEEIEKIKKTE